VSTEANAFQPRRRPPAAPRTMTWWPNQLKLDLLHQHSSKSNPMGGNFDYAKDSRAFDLAAVKKDLAALMADSQDWWAGDFAPLRRSVHSHGVAQRRHLPQPVMAAAGAGRGQQRFAPLNSWPDNVSLDKAASSALADQSRSMAGRFRGRT